MAKHGICKRSPEALRQHKVHKHSQQEHRKAQRLERQRAKKDEEAIINHSNVHHHHIRIDKSVSQRPVNQKRNQ